MYGGLRWSGLWRQRRAISRRPAGWVPPSAVSLARFPRSDRSAARGRRPEPAGARFALYHRRDSSCHPRLLPGCRSNGGSRGRRRRSSMAAARHHGPRVTALGMQPACPRPSRRRSSVAGAGHRDLALRGWAERSGVVAFAANGALATGVAVVAGVATLALSHAVLLGASHLLLETPVPLRVDLLAAGLSLCLVPGLVALRMLPPLTSVRARLADWALLDAPRRAHSGPDAGGEARVMDGQQAPS
jgi:hypothetical protein